MSSAVIALLALATVALAVALQKHARRSQNAEQQIEALERRLEDKQRELSKNFKRLNRLAVDRMVSAERERIMREMHDGMGGNLVATLAMVEAGDYEPAELSEAIRASLDDMRLVIDSLDPDVDDIPTLLGMVRCRLEPRMRRRGLRFIWQVDDLPELDGMGPEQYLHILRIVQEAIANVIKHAEASTITVETSLDDESAVIEVRDDGVGIADEAAPGRGLGNMRHRAEELGGEVSVDATERGTRVKLTIPLRSDASTTRALRHQTITGLDR